MLVRDIADLVISHSDVLTLVSLKRVCTLYYERVSYVSDDHWNRLLQSLLGKYRYLRYVVDNAPCISSVNLQNYTTYLAQLLYKPNGVCIEYMRFLLVCQHPDWRSRLAKVAKAFVAQFPDCKIETTYGERYISVIDRLGTFKEPLCDKYLQFNGENSIARKLDVVLVWNRRWWRF